MAGLDTPAARVRAALASVFGPVTAIGDGFVAQRRAPASPRADAAGACPEQAITILD